MSREATSCPPKGWYPDPFGRFELRFWDGSRWRAEVSSYGRQLIDPLAWPGPSRPERSESASQPKGAHNPLDISPRTPALTSASSLEHAPRTSASEPLSKEERNPATPQLRNAAFVGGSAIAAGVVAVLGEQLASGVAAIIFLAGTLLGSWAVLSGLILWLQVRGPERPGLPKMRTARRPRVPREPKKHVPELSSRCVICGRPLTNAQSMRARVGSTCIKTYGPRYAWVANPAHVAWQRVLAAAEATRAAEQARLTSAHFEAMAVYPRQLSAWEEERRTSLGQSRIARQSLARHRLMLAGMVAPAGFFVGLAAALPLS